MYLCACETHRRHSSSGRVPPHQSLSIVVNVPTVALPHRPLLQHLRIDCWRARLCYFHDSPNSSCQCRLNTVSSSLSHTHTHTYTHTLSLAFIPLFAHSISLSLPLPHSLALSLSPSLSCSLAHRFRVVQVNMQPVRVNPVAMCAPSVVTARQQSCRKPRAARRARFVPLRGAPATYSALRIRTVQSWAW
jgi:hypothetical protein